MSHEKKRDRENPILKSEKVKKGLFVQPGDDNDASPGLTTNQQGVLTPFDFDDHDSSLGTGTPEALFGGRFSIQKPMAQTPQSVTNPAHFANFRSPVFQSPVSISPQTPLIPKPLALTGSPDRKPPVLRGYQSPVAPAPLPLPEIKMTLAMCRETLERIQSEMSACASKVIELLSNEKEIDIGKVQHFAAAQVERLESLLQMIPAQHTAFQQAVTVVRDAIRAKITQQKNITVENMREFVIAPQQTAQTAIKVANK